jgi:hypothetical protein
VDERLFTYRSNVSTPISQIGFRYIIGHPAHLGRASESGRFYLRKLGRFY